ncbi:RING-type E3 ubiquitin transferase [Malassezia sp. CBS 17886]|nr:RING-type E3 ubiquitin transferase [Malassezia sp. CBS 17886]
MDWDGGTDVQEIPTCRICRSEEEADAPLYHPCKCTGSIRHCHQDCLVQWLQHSQKKYCELCSYPFVFHKRYTTAMPQGMLPARLYLWYLGGRAFAVAAYVVRLALVVFCWGILVPFVTFRMWQSYLLWGNAVVNAILGTNMTTTATELAFHLPAVREVSSYAALRGAVLDLGAQIVHALTHRWVDSVLWTAFVAMSFCGLFLLREWVAQYTQQEDDAPADAPMDEQDVLRERVRAVALAAAQARAEHMVALGPAEMMQHGLEGGEEWGVRGVDGGESGAGGARDAGGAGGAGGADGGESAAGTSPESAADSSAENSADSAFGAQIPEHEKSAASTAHGAAAGPAPSSPLSPTSSDWVDEPSGDEDDAGGDDDDWVEESDQETDAPPPPPPRPPPLALPPPPAHDADAPLEREDDEEDAWGDLDAGDHFLEDMEAMFEAIGLHGPLAALGQNLILTQALLCVVMFVLLAVPYFFGRLLGFRIVDAMLLPARALRFVTDPLFEYIIAKAATLLRALGSGLGRVGLQRAVEHRSAGAAATWAATPPVLAPPSVSAPPSVAVPPRALLAAYPHAAAAARHMQSGVQRLAAVGAQLQAYTRGPRYGEQALCILLGHAYTVLFFAAERFLGPLVHGVQRRWAHLLLRQYLTMAKVVLFLALDLVAFPLFCGVLLDWCLFPLFAGASLERLAGDAVAAPITFVFTRWTSGTVYMFHFAQFVSAVRAVVRPGVMCWMRDADDLDFHPIREILEHRSTVQLRKIGDSAVMYGAVLSTLVGVHLRVLAVAVPRLLPLVWAPWQPLMHVPLDLILVHFALHLAIKRTRLTTHAHRLFRRWWIWAAKRLRMSAFLMGDVQFDEQRHAEYASWGAWASALLPGASAAPLRFVNDGGYARVPADDQPALGAPLIIATNADGAPVDAEAQDALDKQLAKIEKLSRKPTYAIVYMPPHFRARVYVLLGLLWVMCSCVAVAAFVGPLVMGRAVVRALGAAPVHDTYTVALGYLLAAAGTLAYQGLAPHPPRRPGVPRASWRMRAAHATRGVGKVVYLLGAFAVVLPFVTGLVLHQYLVPAHAHSADGVPQVNAFQVWALGILSLNTALLGVLMVYPDHYPMLWDIYDNIQHGRIWRAPAAAATRLVLVPALAAAAAALVLPYAVAFVVLWYAGAMDAPASVQQAWLRWSNVGVFAVACIYALWRYSKRNMDTWTGALRDELFLESMELCNYSESLAEKATQPLEDPSSFAMRTSDAGAERRDGRREGDLSTRLPLRYDYAVGLSAAAFLTGAAGAVVYSFRRRRAVDVGDVAGAVGAAGAPVKAGRGMAAPGAAAFPFSLQSGGGRASTGAMSAAPAGTTSAAPTGASADVPSHATETAPKTPWTLFREMNATIFSALRPGKARTATPAVPPASLGRVAVAPNAHARHAPHGLSALQKNAPVGVVQNTSSQRIGALQKAPAPPPSQADAAARVAAEQEARGPDGPLLAFGAFSLATAIVCASTAAAVATVRYALGVKSVEEFADKMHMWMPSLSRKENAAAQWVPSVPVPEGDESSPAPSDVPLAAPLSGAELDERLAQAQDHVEWLRVARTQMDAELAAHSARRAQRVQRAQQSAAEQK